jgi:2-oxoisovalerate dehydrogenase E1 component
MFRFIYTSRCLDDKEIQLKRQNRIFFQISGAGHEAVLVAAGEILKPGYDWFYPYYRDRALCLTLGMTPTEMLLSAVAAADDPNSGGRQMPSHWGHKDLNIVSSSSPTGTQFLQAVGCAEAWLRFDMIEEISDRAERVEPDEVVLCTSGDGSTSEGEFWEALNSACPYLHVEEVDGCDPLACYDVLTRAVSHCRGRRGPSLVHAHVIRPYSHSLSDDEVMYKPQEEREDEAKRDPVTTFPERLIADGVTTEKEIEDIRAKADDDIELATEVALASPQPSSDSIYAHVYSDVDVTGELFDTENEPQSSGGPVTMVDLLNRCLKDEMRNDPTILVFGEDIADISADEHIERVKGKGGVFKVTWGLQKEFGSDRVYNSPLAEANIVGRAIGLATRGFKPVVEIQFFDYIWPAYHQIRNELALMRWRSNGAFKAPVVIRVTYGGYLKGGSIYHSQTGAAVYTGIPGLRVVCPATALDANGMLRTAIRCDDPVIFLEHKHLYRQTYNKGVNPGPEFMIPFGRARVARQGADVTVLTYGAVVQRSVQAARQLEEERGISAEVIDLRSLSPVDWHTIGESVKKTNKVVVAYEDSRSWGYGAELAARLADEYFEWLDAPVRRVAAADTFVAYSPELEDVILPQVGDLVGAIEELHRF